MRCNYRVTCDDRSWNKFLKQGSLVQFKRALHYLCFLLFLVGPYLEVGEFHPVRSRYGPRLHGATRLAHSATMTPMTQMTNDTTTDIQPILERAIRLAFEYIVAECARQREA